MDKSAGYVIIDCADEGGHWLFSGAEIAERKLAEEPLRESEERFRYDPRAVDAYLALFAQKRFAFVMRACTECVEGVEAVVSSA